MEKINGNEDPNIITERLRKQEEERQKRLKDLENFKTAINSAPVDPNVALILKWLSKTCGIGAPIQVLGANGEVQVSSTIFNVGRLSAYQDLRKHMSIETLNVVERSE